MISIQTEDFDVGEEYRALQQASPGCGAIVTFSGIVRDMAGQQRVDALLIEHYPGMTEKSLQSLCEQAHQRWTLGKIRIVHRIGQLAADAQIVFVGVSSQHRAEAFAACEFLMDNLKTTAPLWKKQLSGNTQHWLEAKSSDDIAACRWHKQAK